MIHAKFLTIVLILAVIFTLVVCDESQCNAWDALEQNLKQEDQHVTCNRFQNCSGMRCSGTLHGNELHASIIVNNCENPVSVELSADVPQMKINAWRKKFSHGDSFNFSDSIKGEFQLQDEGNKLKMSLDVQLSVTGMKYLPLPTPLKVSLFRDVTIPVASCNNESTSDATPVTTVSIPSSSSMLSSADLVVEKGNCSISNSSCPPFEMCQQLQRLKPEGVCVCLPDYTRDVNGHCIYTPRSETSTVSPDHPDPKKPRTSNSSLLLTAILVPITVILVIVGMTYATIRFRMCQYLRRRLRVQVYEHVQLGQDDENDIDDNPLENPIA